MSDTIVAVATPAGESALSLIRISGTLALSIMNSALSIPALLQDMHMFGTIIQLKMRF